MANSTIHGEPIYSSLADDPCMGDLVEMYVDEMPGRIVALEQAFAGGDREALRSGAHQMKGAAGSYGFDEVTLAAAALEAAIRDNQAVEIVHRLFDELIQLCRRIRPGCAPAS